MKGLSTFISDDLVSSNLGKDLVLIWEIDKCEKCDIDLYFHSPDGKKERLFHVTKNQNTKYQSAQNKFGDRINVTWVGRNYEAHLKHLKINDTGNFSVQFYHLSNGLENISHYPSFISIIEPNGTCGFFFIPL